jgi:hypothetical protein
MCKKNFKGGKIQMAKLLDSHLGNLIEDQTQMKITSEINLFFKVFHTMECINFAFPFHDWDHEGGDGRQHYLR